MRYSQHILAFSLAILSLPVHNALLTLNIHEVCLDHCKKHASEEAPLHGYLKWMEISLACIWTALLRSACSY